MSRGVPLIRQLNLRLAILSILPFTIVALGSLWMFGSEQSLLAAAIVWAYLLVTLFIRRRLLAHHRAGLRAIRRGAWDAAVGHFRASHDTFSRRPALDRHRWLFLSGSSMSFAEMGLLNVAFCQAQAGRRAEAQATYERVLVEFHGSPLAITSLNLMRDPPQPGLTESAPSA